MTNKRKTDENEGTHFRSKRIMRENEQWFFTTREGTMEGPFASEMEAKRRLEVYIKLMKIQWLDEAKDLTLVPK